MRKIALVLTGSIVSALAVVVLAATMGANLCRDIGIIPDKKTESTICATEESTVLKDNIVLSTEPTVPYTEPVVSTSEPTVPDTEPEPETTEPAIEPEQEVNDWTSLGTFKLTAYCSCSKCCGQYALNRPTDENGNPIVYAASGARAEAGVTIAVDPGVIPYGTVVQINGHTYIAQDTGGAIRGNRIDVYFDDHQEAWNFGTQNAEVFVNV